MGQLQRKSGKSRAAVIWHPEKLRCQPMSAMRTANAASRLSSKGPVWAVRVDGGPPVVRKCCDQSIDGMELKSTDAAVCSNVSGAQKADFANLQSLSTSVNIN